MLCGRYAEIASKPGNHPQRAGSNGGQNYPRLEGFCHVSRFSIIREYLCGTTASSVNEAKLGSYEFGGEVHAYAPAYSEKDIHQLSPLIKHITFNSFSQFHRFKDQVSNINPQVSMGLRINPEYSEVATELYDPCRPCSRLGMTLQHLRAKRWKGLKDFIFTPCVSRTQTHWNARSRWLKRNSRLTSSN